jgi:hypothetical protein
MFIAHKMNVSVQSSLSFYSCIILCWCSVLDVADMFIAQEMDFSVSLQIQSSLSGYSCIALCLCFVLVLLYGCVL